MFYLFFLGIPVISIIILKWPDNDIDILLTSINKIDSGDAFVYQIRIFLKHVENRKKTRESNLYIHGYTHLFETTCMMPECSLKKYKILKEEGDDSTVTLYQHAQFLYQNGISKFPKCANLRILYSLFLLNKMKNKNQALMEFVNTEKNTDPDFDEQFVIFRYKKIIEDQMLDSNVSGVEENLDVVANIAYKNHFNQCKKLSF